MAVWIVLVIAASVVAGYMICRHLRQNQEGEAWAEGYNAGRDDEVNGRSLGSSDWNWPANR